MKISHSAKFSHKVQNIIYISKLLLWMFVIFHQSLRLALPKPKSRIFNHLFMCCQFTDSETHTPSCDTKKRIEIFQFSKLQESFSILLIVCWLIWKFKNCPKIYHFKSLKLTLKWFLKLRQTIHLNLEALNTNAI